MRNHQVLTAPLTGNGKARRAVDLVYRFQPGVASPALPASSGEANIRLSDGNKKIARFIRACRTGDSAAGHKPAPILLDAHEVGQGPDAAGYPKQEPFALVVGCADARAPAEITFGQSFNDLFNIRVAGNVLGVECAGSVRYALAHFAPCSQPVGSNTRSLRLMLALGHRNCGAVQAAVEAYQRDLAPDAMPDGSTEAILRRISFPSLMVAVEAFDAVPGYGPGASRDRRNTAALNDVVVVLNAAWTARELGELIPHDPVTQRSVDVVYGVFDPRDFLVSVDSRPRFGDEDDTFASPPRDLKDLRELAVRLVTSTLPA